MDLTRAEICAAMKQHGRAIKEHCGELDSLFCDIRKARRHDQFAWPEGVREAALNAIAGMNKFDFCTALELDILHDALDLGPLNISGPCDHERKK